MRGRMEITQLPVPTLASRCPPRGRGTRFRAGRGNGRTRGGQPRHVGTCTSVDACRGLAQPACSQALVCGSSGPGPRADGDPGCGLRPYPGYGRGRHLRDLVDARRRVCPAAAMDGRGSECVQGCTPERPGPTRCRAAPSETGAPAFALAPAPTSLPSRPPVREAPAPFRDANEAATPRHRRDARRRVCPGSGHGWPQQRVRTGMYARAAGTYPVSRGSIRSRRTCIRSGLAPAIATASRMRPSALSGLRTKPRPERSRRRAVRPPLPPA